jgi:hypothetical protein
MVFSSYKYIGSVLKEFQITYTEADFMNEVEFSVSDYFREDLQIIMQEGVVDNSSLAVCQSLINPVLKEVWKRYSNKLTLWSQEFLNSDSKLSGFPQYILAKRSPLGKVVFDQPYLLLVEAKQDKFDQGWAQCLAEMIAAQRLNGEKQLVIFGIVTNGKAWEFGKLEKMVFTSNNKFYLIQELDKLFAAINFVFKQCEMQLNELVAT